MKKRILAVLMCATVSLLLNGCAVKEEKEESSKITKTSHSSEVIMPNDSNGDSSLENTSISDSKPEESKTNVLYANCEKLDFPVTPLTDFEYEIDGNFVKITEYFGKNTDVRFPETISRRSTEICIGEFEDHGTIKRLIVPSGMTISSRVNIDFAALDVFDSLESLTFLGDCHMGGSFSYKEKLKDIYFGGDIPDYEDIREYFYATPWFDSINNWEGLVVINDTVVFSANCSGDIVVPEGVTKISDGAFYVSKDKAANLQNVKLPEGITYIGVDSFRNTGLQSINIPDSVMTICDNAFTDTAYLESKMNNDKLCIDGKWLLDGKKSFGHLIIPDGVEFIANGAFKRVKLQSLVLSEGLLNIGEDAFWYTEFKDIKLPENIAHIENNAFYGSSLFEIDKYKGFDVIVVDKIAIVGPGASGKDIVIPNGITTISFNNVFDGSVKSMVLPDSFTEYNNKAFGTDRTIAFTKTVIYKGETYNVYDLKLDREALKSAIEGNR